MKLHIVAPALPPLLDGIGDYTAALVAQIADRADVTLLTGEGYEPAPIANARIVPAFRADAPQSVLNIGQIIRRERPDWLLVQYNPFMYGKWGRNPHLPIMLQALKRDLPGTRLAVMGHESFVPANSLRFAVMATWQRAQLRQIGRASDALFFSIQPWATRFTPWFPDTPVTHLPVGSNMRRVNIGRNEARARLGFTNDDLVIGLYGTAHISRMLPLIGSTLQTLKAVGHKPTLLYIGPDAQAVRGVAGDVPVKTEGTLPFEEVSRRFGAMDIYLAPFLDGVSTRRTSFMAALQHGVATTGTRGVWSDRMLLAEQERAFLLADVSKPTQFHAHTLRLANDASLRAQIGASGAALFARRFSPERLADRLLATLAAVERGEPTRAIHAMNNTTNDTTDDQVDNTVDNTKA